MFDRIYSIIRKELLQTMREPRMRFIIWGPLIVELLLFGFAVNLDIENVKIAWMDRDRTPHSRSLLEAFSGSRTFTVASAPTGDAQAQRLLDRGEVLAVITISPGFARDLERKKGTSIQVLVDGANSNTAALVSNHILQVVSDFQAPYDDEAKFARPTRIGPSIDVNVHQTMVASRSRIWFNQELKSRNYFVPGVIVNMVMITTLVLTALAIVRERETGTLEQLMVSPVKPLELIIGKTVPYALVGFFQLIVATLLALAIFQIPFRGNPLVLLVAGGLFLMTTLGGGVFLSTISSTQQQAALSCFMVLVPVFLLSGFAFPLGSMPTFFQYLSYLDPMRYFIEIMRDVFLKGAGLDVLWPQLLALGGFGLTAIGLSSLCFRKRLD